MWCSIKQLTNFPELITEHSKLVTFREYQPKYLFKVCLTKKKEICRKQNTMTDIAMQIVPQKKLSSDFEHQYLLKLWIDLNLHNKIITNYLHLSIKPHLIWFSSHIEIRNFIRHVISPFHPNFDRKETPTTQWTLNSTLLLNG